MKPVDKLIETVAAQLPRSERPAFEAGIWELRQSRLAAIRSMTIVLVGCTYALCKVFTQHNGEPIPPPKCRRWLRWLLERLIIILIIAQTFFHFENKHQLQQNVGKRELAQLQDQLIKTFSLLEQRSAVLKNAQIALNREQMKYLEVLQQINEDAAEIPPSKGSLRGQAK